MILSLNVSISDAAEESVDYKPALDVMPDPGQGRIKLLSALLICHGHLTDRGHLVCAQLEARVAIGADRRPGRGAPTVFDRSARASRDNHPSDRDRSRPRAGHSNEAGCRPPEAAVPNQTDR